MPLTRQPTQHGRSNCASDEVKSFMEHGGSAKRRVTVFFGHTLNLKRVA